MNAAIEPPPQRAGLGCVGTGCVTLVCLLIFLVIAFVGGGYWALHHLQKKYSGTAPLSFANITSSESTISPDPSNVTSQTVPSSDTTLTPEVPRETAAAIRARWRAFEKAADRHEKARVELSADDINTLIQNDPKLRGKAAVTIENNVARVRVSIPLGGVFMMDGRYLNGEATVQSAADGNPQNAQISNIILADQAVPNHVLDQRLFGWSPIRGYINDWLGDKDVGYFSIQNNRVIGETRGSR